MSFNDPSHVGIICVGSLMNAKGLSMHAHQCQAHARACCSAGCMHVNCRNCGHRALLACCFRYQDSDANDGQYWPLDYPPLSGWQVCLHPQCAQAPHIFALCCLRFIMRSGHGHVLPHVGRRKSAHAMWDRDAMLHSLPHAELGPWVVHQCCGASSTVACSIARLRVRQAEADDAVHSAGV